jgi:hypothetical protein
MIYEDIKTIDITQILSPDLKSRTRVHDLDLFIRNCGEEDVVLDFSKVQFATRSCIDEFYNLFLKNSDELPYRVKITNMPEDINTILETVSHTQSGVKVIPSHIPERKFRDVKELLQFLSSVAL